MNDLLDPMTKNEIKVEDVSAHICGTDCGHDDTEIQQTFIREGEKIGRNEPCPCGSGKKYKKCCLL